MFSRIIATFLIFVSLPLIAMAADDTTMISSVMKIKTYERNSIDGNYVFSHYGSAVLIDSKRIITNAHVVLDADNKLPTGYYEICKSEKNKKVPTCFTTAKLISYDTIADIAVLELVTPITGAKGVSFADKKELSVATPVVVYGYPSIGGMSITRTEGKIGGIDNTAYKFDGTIDRGNSGGGAFGSDGKFIGMPYAVKSDNGMIGYIIPVSRIVDFLAGKTDNIEKYTTKINTNFAPYIKSIQLLYKNPNLLKTKYIELKDADKNGFILAGAASSISGNIFTYYFLDKNSRVGLTLSCSSDASKTWKDSIQLSQDAVLSQKNTRDSKVTSVGSFVDTNKNLYMNESTVIKETKGERGVITVIAYRNAPTCATMIVSQDGKKKDKTSYDKAMLLAKGLKFTSTNTIQDSFISSFFSLRSIPNNAYIGQVISFGDMQPNIAIMLPSKVMIYSSFALLKFDDLDGYMNYEYSDSNQYSGKKYSFNDFFTRFKTTGYSNVSDEVVTTKNNKKLIITIKDYTDSTVSPEKFEKLITFFYPFVTVSGEYRAYKIEFTVITDNMDIQQVRELIESLEFPGKSPFTE